MDKTHGPTVTDRDIHVSEVGSDEVVAEKRDTSRDAEDMKRLGRAQELKVREWLSTETSV